MFELSVKIDSLKVTQVRAVTDEHVKAVCNVVGVLMKGATLDAQTIRKHKASVEKHCSQLSIHASCLPADAEHRADLIHLSDFMRMLCLAGEIENKMNKVCFARVVLCYFTL